MDNLLVNVPATCHIKKSPQCWVTKNYGLDAEKYAAWVAGMHIQDVWPRMSLGDREFLISGCCGACFDEIFGEDES